MRTALLVVALLAAAPVNAERAWSKGTVVNIEHKANWGMDRHATLYKIESEGATLTVADIPQTVWGAAPKPLCDVGTTIGVESPKADGRWKSKVRVRFGLREKKLYFDSQSATTKPTGR